MNDECMHETDNSNSQSSFSLTGSWLTTRSCQKCVTKLPKRKFKNLDKWQQYNAEHQGIELVEVKQNAGLGWGGSDLLSHATSAFNKHQQLTKKHLQICSKKSATIFPKLK